MISVNVKLKNENKNEHKDARLYVRTDAMCSVCGEVGDLALAFTNYHGGRYAEVVVCKPCADRLLAPMSDIEFEMLLEEDL